MWDLWGMEHSGWWRTLTLNLSVRYIFLYSHIRSYFMTHSFLTVCIHNYGNIILYWVLLSEILLIILLFMWSFLFFLLKLTCWSFVIGIDYLSVAAYDDLIPSHLVFLESRVRNCYLIRHERVFSLVHDHFSWMRSIWYLVDCWTVVNAAPKKRGNRVVSHGSLI